MELPTLSPRSPVSITEYTRIALAKKNWSRLSDSQREDVLKDVAAFRNEVLRMAADRGFPHYEADNWYVVSQPAWEQFTARATIEVLMTAALELEDLKSMRIRESKVVLFEWPDPTEGMFDEIGASDE